ncbi:MAG: hypothetical protein IJ035_00135 [Oscillospiraceae bacterium]|nr:hypothetical protein [Oscillospiraceae bacterium]
MRFVKILTALFLAACLTACSNNENDMDGANYWDSEGNPITFSGNFGTEISEADETVDEHTENLCPFGDISADKIRLTAPAYAPYLLEATAEQTKFLAEAMSSTLWKLADENSEIPDGERYLVFVYNNGQPFELIFYPSADLVGFLQNGNETLYKIDGEAYSAVRELLQHENPEDIRDLLVWCDPENITGEGVWQNESRAENEIKLETVEIVPQCKPSMGFEFGLPEGWTYTAVHTDDEPTSNTSAYLIPKEMEGLADGSVLTIEYRKDGFLVCGTGLVQKNIDFNGYSATQGFYDGNEHWSYISLKGEYDGCVVHCSPTVANDYSEIIDAVLPTIKFKFYDE